jgi:hypothetical protein
MLITTNRGNNYQIFDTDTGTRYLLTLYPESKRPIDCKVESIHANADDWPILMTGQEALDFWSQLAHHESMFGDDTKFIWEAYNKGKALLEQKK